MLSPLEKKVAKSSNSYYCKCCDYISSKKCNWLKHIKTKKHLEKCHLALANNVKKVAKYYFCENCSKKYKSRNGLWKHSKNCKKTNVAAKSNPQTIIQHITNNQIINNNSNYINVNLFLNEHCKNAMNLEDFVKSLNLSLKDLDYTTKNGYVEGMTSILTKSLGDLSPTDRPIHSTDEKRLKFMVKNEEGWIKDDGSQLNNVVSKTKFKLVDTLSAWEKENPGYNNDSKKLDTWQKSLSSISPEPSIKEKYDNAIKKKLAKLSSIKGAMDSINNVN